MRNERKLCFLPKFWMIQLGFIIWGIKECDIDRWIQRKWELIGKMVLQVEVDGSFARKLSFPCDPKDAVNIH
jgi:hypothetical protein